MGTFCNYNDPGIGFPRDCGPTGFSGSQWNSKNRGGKRNWAYFVRMGEESGNSGLPLWAWIAISVGIVLFCVFLAIILFRQSRRRTVGEVRGREPSTSASTGRHGQAQVVSVGPAGQNEWTQFRTPEGREYWYNRSSGASQWERPVIQAPPQMQIAEPVVGKPVEMGRVVGVSPAISPQA